MTSTAIPPLKVLRCSGTADFLAALPRLVGFAPTNSLLIVFFSGNRSGSTLRIDLPAEDSPRETSVFLDELCLLLRKLRKQYGPGSPAVVISCEQTFASAKGLPWRKFARSLERRLARDGDRVRELCCIAPDAWASYLDPSTPLLGHSLDEITQSPVAEASVPPGLGDLGAFNSASEKDRSRVSAAIGARTGDRQALGGATSGGAALVGAALVGVAEPELEMIADTIVTANTEAGWIAIFEQIAATAEGFLSARGLNDTEENQREAVHRLRLASDRLTQAAALAPRSLQAPVMAASAIAWWLRGLQSVAYRQISEAFEIDPHSEPVRVVRRYIESGDHSPIPGHA